MVYPKVAIIGSGNLALLLCRNLEDIGISIVSVYSRKIKNARNLSSRLYNAEAVDDLDFSSSLATVYFICVTDNAITEIVREIVLPPMSLLVHSSGSTSLAEIHHSEAQTGVFYPVQTFTSGRKISFVDVPVCIEAISEKSEKLLESIAKGLKAKPFFMNSEQRLTLHLAAVFACNFSNHLFSISKQLLEKEGLPFSLLHQLIAETVQKALDHDPAKVQTGPAARNDTKTMRLHENMLEANPDWIKLYHMLSVDIMKLNELKSI